MEQCVSLQAASGGAAANVIQFVRPAASIARLSVRDRMDIVAWREAAGRLGYDRLVIHERGSDDPPELVSFLSIYRRGAHWASWSLARRGATVVAWCSTTGTDVGRFASMSEALGTLLVAP